MVPLSCLCRKHRIIYLIPSQIVVFEATNPHTNEPVTLKVVYKSSKKMDECVQFYNVLFNRVMRKLNMSKIGNNYYAPGGSVLVPQHKYVIQLVLIVYRWYVSLCILYMCDFGL